MQRYIVRRLLLMIPTMIGITLVVFMAVRFLPGGVIDQMIGEYGDPTPDYRERLEERYSLNDSIPQQYVQWVGRLVQGDFGLSITSGRPVIDDLKSKLPVTLQLGLMSLILAQVIALPIGVLSAIRQDTPADYIGRSLAIGMLAIPSFWLALLALTYGFIWFGWVPPLGYVRLWDDPVANLKILWLPAFILGAIQSGSVMRLTRTTMLDVLRQDYVRTAWSKGLRERVIIVRHCLRNALIPVITIIGLQMAGVFGGTVVLERIFGIPGMGSYMLSMIEQRDYPVVQAIVLITATMVVISNLLVDLSYAVLDPRIRYA